MLRAFLDSPSNIDVAEELARRNDFLQTLRGKAFGPAQGLGAGFAQAVLGASAPVSKAARKQLDVFLKGTLSGFNIVCNTVHVTYGLTMCTDSSCFNVHPY